MWHQLTKNLNISPPEIFHIHANYHAKVSTFEFVAYCPYLENILCTLKLSEHVYFMHYNVHPMLLCYYGFHLLL